MACVWHPRLQFESLSLSARCPFTPQQCDTFRISFPILADGSGESKAQSSISEQENLPFALKCSFFVYHFVLVQSGTLWSLDAAYFQSRHEHTHTHTLCLSLSLSLRNLSSFFTFAKTCQGDTSKTSDWSDNDRVLLFVVSQKLCLNFRGKETPTT